MTTAGYVAMCQAASVAHAPAEISGTPISPGNKTDLVGCWTDMHWVKLPNVETGNPTEKTQVGSTMCFDGEIYYYLKVFPVDAMGIVGRYKVSAPGSLELSAHSRDWFSYRMNISFPSRNELSGKYLVGDDKPPKPFLLRRDPSNKTYLKLKDLYEDWMRAERAASH